MWAAEEGMRQRGTQYGQTGRCQEWGPGEQEEVERDRPVAEVVGRAGPGFPGLAGFGLIQRGSLCDVDLLVDRHPVVVRRVAHLACTLQRSAFELGFKGLFLLFSVPRQDQWSCAYRLRPEI